MPTTGTFPMTPSTLRGITDNNTYVSVYLNGLRLADDEWNYTYDSGTSEKRLTFDGSSNITLVAGDVIVVDVKVIS
jgi:hypothetical protein